PRAVWCPGPAPPPPPQPGEGAKHYFLRAVPTPFFFNHNTKKTNHTNPLGRFKKLNNPFPPHPYSIFLLFFIKK
ncbi:hypothetical protein ACVGWG_00030, partial [Enterobacter asburiae]